jgi:hypothetical protein
MIRLAIMRLYHCLYLFQTKKCKDFICYSYNYIWIYDYNKYFYYKHIQSRVFHYRNWRISHHFLYILVFQHQRSPCYDSRLLYKSLDPCYIKISRLLEHVR